MQNGSYSSTITMRGRDCAENLSHLSVCCVLNLAVVGFDADMKLRLMVKVLVGGADGWAKNQLGERRLGELFFGRQTIGRQQSFQKRRFAERRLGDKGMQFAFLLASINSTSSALTHWMQSFNASFQHGILRHTRCLVVGS